MWHTGDSESCCSTVVAQQARAHSTLLLPSPGQNHAAKPGDTVYVRMLRDAAKTGQQLAFLAQAEKQDSSAAMLHRTVISSTSRSGQNRLAGAHGTQQIDPLQSSVPVGWGGCVRWGRPSGGKFTGIPLSLFFKIIFYFFF